jgi:hypothetical protein
MHVLPGNAEEKEKQHGEKAGELDHPPQYGGTLPLYTLVHTMH